MAIAATGDVDLAKECSLASAREMKAVGINWCYSPVGDVNSNPQNPVIGGHQSTFFILFYLTFGLFLRCALFWRWWESTLF